MRTDDTALREAFLALMARTRQLAAAQPQHPDADHIAMLADQIEGCLRFENWDRAFDLMGLIETSTHTRPRRPRSPAAIRVMRECARIRLASYDVLLRLVEQEGISDDSH